MPPRSRPLRVVRVVRVRSRLLELGAVVIAGAWLGCASNGDPTANEPVPAATATSTAAPDPSTRPAFEAGFPDTDGGAADAAVDPTVDGGGTCIDNGDPGGAENVAKALPDTSDAQNTAISVSGVMNGVVDVDFYRLKVADLSFHLLQPDIQATSSGIEMCVFVKCNTTGSSNVTCGAPALPAKSDLGTDGCCGTGPSSVTPTWNCSTTDDSAELFIRITQPTDKCLPYTFSYAF